MKVHWVRGFALFTVVCVGVSLAGCGPGKVEMREINKSEGVADADVAKAKESLKAAGITGEVLRVEDMGDTWEALVKTMKDPEPGKRPTPSPPASYTIDKATGKVESGMAPQ